MLSQMDLNTLRDSDLYEFGFIAAELDRLQGANPEVRYTDLLDLLSIAVIRIEEHIEEVRDQGFDEGYSVGFFEADSQAEYAIDMARDEGYQEGYESGFEDGYDKGTMEAEEE